MHRWRRLARWVLACGLLITLPGCWDYQRINYRESIIGIGLDPAPDQPNQLRFTFQSPVFANAGQQGQGAGQPQAPSQASSTSSFRNYTVVARSLHEAITNAQVQADKQFFLGNLQAIVFNRNISPEMLRKVISELIRDPTVDNLAFILATDDSATELMNSGANAAPSDRIDRLLEESVRQHAHMVRTRLWEVWRDQETSGRAVRVGMVHAGNELSVGGLLALQQAKPILELTPEDVMGYEFAIGKAQEANLTIRMQPAPGVAESGAADGGGAGPAGGGGSAGSTSAAEAAGGGTGEAMQSGTSSSGTNTSESSMGQQEGEAAQPSFVIRVVRSESRTGVQMQNGRLILPIRVRVFANLMRDASDGQEEVSMRQLQQYEQLAAQDIRRRILHTLDLCQQSGADIYGYGTRYFARHPEQRIQLAPRWPDLFRDAQPQVQVEVILTLKGSLM
ncbi:MAG: hypothetical protein K6T26_05470 [Alicyclobacillus sp.]|nr:hypothetical protein [Alicyclobacillus sp.]